MEDINVNQITYVKCAGDVGDEELDATCDRISLGYLNITADGKKEPCVWVWQKVYEIMVPRRAIMMAHVVEIGFSMPGDDDQYADVPEHPIAAP